MNDVQFYLPITKIDKERRIVTGVATADNIDKEDDLIEFEASVAAFANWIGNIREMHMPKAVGKKLEHRLVDVVGYDGRMYQGVEVDVYVSKGAQDTWEKVLDGTLSGFSIGGAALEKEMDYDPDTGKSFRRIKKYILNELSLVDNPCNPLGMFTMIKSVDSSPMSADDLKSHTVYYCPHDNFVRTDNDRCVYCGGKMEGFATVDSLNIDYAMNKVSGNRKEGNMEDLLHNDEDANIIDMSKFDDEQKSLLSKIGDVIVGEKDKVSTDDAARDLPQINITVNVPSSVEKTVTTESFSENGGGIEKSETETVEDEVEDTDSIEKGVEAEVEDKFEGGNENMEFDFEKVTAAFGDLLDEKLSSLKSEISADVDEKLNEIQKSVDEVKESTETAISEVTEDLEKVSASGAGAKSVETGEEIDEDTLEKSAPAESFWGGIFVPAEIAGVLGYES